MKRTVCKGILYLFVFIIQIPIPSYASIPLWQFTPLTATTFSISKSQTKEVRYQVTNNSSSQHILKMQAIKGVRQLTGPNRCANPARLLPKSACTLVLEINGSELNKPIQDGPILCQEGSSLQCYRPKAQDVLNISLVAEKQYRLGGSITGLSSTVVLLNNGAEPLTTNTDGPFTFSKSLNNGQSYFVTVGTQPLNQTCSVSNGVGVIQSGNVMNVTVVCAANAYTLGGMVSGLVGTVTLTNNGSDALPLTTNSNFTFPTPIAQGAPYQVAVQSQPLGQTCTIINGNGFMGGANVTNVQVTCSNISYTVGGTVSGLSATLTLLNNGADPDIIHADGNFVFSTPLASGSSYNVTVGTQPSGQTCLVSNGFGSILGQDITNVALNCTHDTTTLSIPATATIPVSSSGTPSTLTVSNTGLHTALNVHAELPSGWVGSVNQDVSDCLSLAPGQSCNLGFSAAQAFVAQGAIVVTGDYVSNAPTLAMAFTVDGYLVWQVSGSTVQVIDTVDLAASIWGPVPEVLGSMAQSLIDGFANTDFINASGSGPVYAARSCYNKTPTGTWYLPAICQMSASATCGVGLANINSNLAQLGFGGFANTGYWSSTQDSVNPSTDAWKQSFGLIGVQHAGAKAAPLAIRCARGINIV